MRLNLAARSGAERRAGDSNRYTGVCVLEHVLCGCVFYPLSLICWHLHNLKRSIHTVLAEETKETKEKSRKQERKPDAKNAVVELTKVENVCILKMAHTRIPCILHTVILLPYYFRS